jgi:membrane fusion protein (multidrug efflux system)
VFLVPQSAVLQTEKGYFVFVVDGEGKAAARTVQTGAWVGSDWTILSGLNGGDRVIVDNLLKIRPGAAVTATLQANASTATADAKSATAPPNTDAKPIR